mmetsp:Transcript_15031/g.34420  ORF Transcript_15031/g.34420 Transcript_15031/m.34420 type:complete len:246 (-) Transcript_15031:20-757(-)
MGSRMIPRNLFLVLRKMPVACVLLCRMHRGSIVHTTVGTTTMFGFVVGFDDGEMIAVFACCCLLLLLLLLLVDVVGPHNGGRSGRRAGDRCRWKDYELLLRGHRCGVDASPLDQKLLLLVLCWLLLLLLLLVELACLLVVDVVEGVLLRLLLLLERLDVVDLVEGVEAFGLLLLLLLLGLLHRRGGNHGLDARDVHPSEGCTVSAPGSLENDALHALADRRESLQKQRVGADVLLGAFRDASEPP